MQVMKFKGRISGLEIQEASELGKKKLEMENLFWRDLHHLGIHPMSLDILGERVRVSDGMVDVHISIRDLSAGLSVLEHDEGKRLLIKGRPFARQIRYLSWKGRRA